MSYKPFLHVERLNAPEVRGILDATVSISSKIDGTNAVVWSDNGQICAGSRKRELRSEQDNAGFYNWITASNDTEAELLRDFVLEHPNLIVYGEWMGDTKFVGAIKSYSQDAHRKMYIFDIYDINDQVYLLEKEWRDLIKDTGLEPYTTEYYGEFDNLTSEKIAEIAKHNHYLLPANIIGEGIVIKPATQWRNRFGRQAYAKYIYEDFDKVKKSKKAQGNNAIEEDIVDTYLTVTEMDKNKAKVEARFNETFNPKNSSHIGMFLNLCYFDSVLDSIKTIVKKYKNPVIHFAQLKKLTVKKAKQYVSIETF